MSSLLDRISGIIGGGGDLLEARAGLVVADFKQSRTVTTWWGAAIGVIGIGCLLALAGGIVGLATVIGTAWALVVAGAAVCLTGAGLAMYARRVEERFNAERKPRLQQVESAKARIKAAVAVPTSSATAATIDSFAEKIRPSPVGVASMAFAAVSLLGVGRSLRFLSRAAAALAAAHIQQTRETRPREPGAGSDRPRPPTEPGTPAKNGSAHASQHGA